MTPIEWVLVIVGVIVALFVLRILLGAAFLLTVAVLADRQARKRQQRHRHML